MVLSKAVWVASLAWLAVSGAEAAADGTRPADRHERPLYFAAVTKKTGMELWRLGSDGSISVVTEKIVPGAGSSLMNGEPGLTEFNGSLYFNAQTPEGYGELWRIGPDGELSIGWNATPEQGLILASFEMGVYQGNLYFSARDLHDGYELWRINPQGELTKVRDIATGLDRFGQPASSDPFGFFQFAGGLIFTAVTEKRGFELWRLDSSGDVKMLKDINKGPSSSGPLYGFTAFNKNAYFMAYTFRNGVEVWRLGKDGTIRMAADIAPGDSSGLNGNGTKFVQFAGALYFPAAKYGYELDHPPYIKPEYLEPWRITKAGVTEQAATTNKYCGNFLVFNGYLYFTAFDYEFSGASREVRADIWRMNKKGKVQLVAKNIAAWNLVVHDGALFFSGYNPRTDPATWVPALYRLGEDHVLTKLTSSAMSVHRVVGSGY